MLQPWLKKVRDAGIPLFTVDTISPHSINDTTSDNFGIGEKLALQLASDINQEDTQLQFTINYKHDANYDYWQNRANFEQTPDALKARELMFTAKKAFKEADIAKAKQLYQEGFLKFWFDEVAPQI